MNDDNFAVYCSCETICVSECFVCMCVYLFILCVGNVDDLLVVQLLVDKALEHPQVDHAEHLQ